MSKRMKVNISKMSKEQCDLLKGLYSIHSPSGKENVLSKAVKAWLDKAGIPYNEDKYGQLWYVDREMPCLSAHMDQVQNKAPKFKDIKDEFGVIYADGFGLGADDKNGVWIILCELYRRKVMGFRLPSYILSVQEESLSGKAGECFMDHFTEDEKSIVPFCVVLDRRGNGDIIGWKNDYCSQAFEQAIHRISKDNTLGYSPTLGAFSDADAISEYTNCVNLSVGYYNPHSDKECTNKNDLMRAWEFVQRILEPENIKTLSQIKFEGKQYLMSEYDFGYKYNKFSKKRYKTIPLYPNEIEYLKKMLSRRENEVGEEIERATWEGDEEKITLLNEELNTIDSCFGAMFEDDIPF